MNETQKAALKRIAKPVVTIGLNEEGGLVAVLTTCDELREADAIARAIGVAIAQLGVSVKSEHTDANIESVMMELIAQCAESARYAVDMWLAGDIPFEDHAK